MHRDSNLIRWVHLIACAFLALTTPLSASDDTISIYIDADYSVTPAPAEAIEIGLRSAFAGTWAETGIAVVRRDHRRNARRSLDTIREAMRDPSAVAVLGGMESPVYFANGPEINMGGLPLLLPWSAGDMLTRLAEGDANWIFRLSVDDTKAASMLVAYGQFSNCKTASLIFVDNAWGNGNAKRIAAEIETRGGTVASRHPLPFNAGEQLLVELTRSVDRYKVDCVYLVSALAHAKPVIGTIGAQDNPPRIISHWGILGDRITNHIDYQMLENAQLTILGTCGLNDAQRNWQVFERAREAAKQIVGGNFDPEFHPAPHGFFHAHDIGLILKRAIEIARETDGWEGGATARREAVRAALYQVKAPIEGVLKTYVAPFDQVSQSNLDGHEALSRSDLCMTSVDDLGHVVSLTSSDGR
ncbi:MAG: ABC transporter substrate-binding protein [Pseudomonadota bacterium]